jgi:predicted AlkP superfamily pyrophosphatase or phosphodiesterase
MRSRAVLRFLILSTLVTGVVPVKAAEHAIVVLVSIDGLRPDYVLDADKHGLRIPNLRRFLTEGSFATGVKGVIPTVTYPSHTTIVTGVWPSRHGIYANHPFDPFGRNQGGWYWYAEDIRVPTLWDAGRDAGLTTANIHWPVTVGARITYNLPQIWRAGTEEDRKLLRALSTSGLLDELERDLGPYADGEDESVAGDQLRGRFAVHLLEKKKPGFLAVYFASLDSEQHNAGPFSASSLAVLESIDKIIGALRSMAERVSGDRAVLCVVSDHGFVATEKEVNLLAAFRSAGLIEFDEGGRVTSWQATTWQAGASAAVMLNPNAGTAVRTKVHQLLDRLADDPANGISEVIQAERLHALGGFPQAAFLVGLRHGYKLGPKTTGPLVVTTKTGGMHGYLPQQAEMNSSFFIVGAGIPVARSLGEIDMRDIAPTLADLLGIALPSADGKSCLRRTRSRGPQQRPNSSTASYSATTF